MLIKASFLYLIASQLYKNVDFSSDEDFRRFTVLSGISLLTEESAERKTLSTLPSPLCVCVRTCPIRDS